MRVRIAGAGLGLAGALLLTLPLASVVVPVQAAEQVTPGPVPRAKCGPGSLPETDLQGRIPPKDVASGRAAKGYTCNTQQIGLLPSSAGWRTERYKNCAYYNGEPGGAPLFVATDPSQAGTRVVDVSNPRKPVETAFLRTPAMASPHESMNLHQGRGLLIAVTGNLATLPGVIDIYDVKTDCRKPKLLSSVKTDALLGHEAGVSPDGKTFYVGSTGGGTLTAVDISDPRKPGVVPLAVERVSSHGLSLSADGNLLYDTVTSGPDAGMIIYDVSSIQSRSANPDFKVVSKISWPEISIPQSTIPVVIGGRRYVIESDEFQSDGPSVNEGNVGASRIIDVQDPQKPKLVSNIRLEVHMPANRDKIAGDTEGFIGGAYSGHFCSVPRLVNPEILACSMLRSGVRVFDIRNPQQPREVAYFSPPARHDTRAKGGRCSCLHTGATIAFVPERSEMWLTGQQTGFHVVRFTNGVFGSPPAPARRPAAGAAVPAQRDAEQPQAAGTVQRAARRTLPATGSPENLALLGVVLLLLSAAGLRWAARRP